MNKKVFVASLIVALSSTTMAHSQSSAPSTLELSPSKPFSADFSRQASLSNLWVAKIEANGDPVTLLRPKLKVEYSKGPIFITKTVYLTEQKTRTVDGRDEVYTVEVPYTVREEKYPAMSIPDGVDRYTIPISKIKGWYIDGIVLTPEILAKELKTPKHVFVSEFLHDDFAGLDPYFRSVFQSQVIFLCIPSGTQSDAEYQKSSSKK